MRPERQPLLVELDDGRTGLMLDADAIRTLRGIANGLALSGIGLLLVAAGIALVRMAL